MRQRFGLFFLILGVMAELFFVFTVWQDRTVYDLFFLGILLWFISALLLRWEGGAA